MEAILEQPAETETMYSCTFVGMLGDITLQWDEQNKEHILEVIRKKMKEGYSFFTTKKYMFGKITRKSLITPTDLNRGTIKDIIITDEEFNKMVEDLRDSDIAGLVKDSRVNIGKINKGKEMIAMKKAKTAEEVVKSNSVAIKPIVGG